MQMMMTATTMMISSNVISVNDSKMTIDYFKRISEDNRNFKFPAVNVVVFSNFLYPRHVSVTLRRYVCVLGGRGGRAEEGEEVRLSKSCERTFCYNEHMR